MTNLGGTGVLGAPERSATTTTAVRDQNVMRRTNRLWDVVV